MSNLIEFFHILWFNVRQIHSNDAISFWFGVQLVCDGEVDQTWINVPFNTLEYLAVSPFVNAADDCYLRTVAGVKYVLDAISSKISVGNIDLVITEPVANSTIIIPSTFPLLVSNPQNTSISYSAVAMLYCNASTLTSFIPFTTNVITSVNYGNDFYGPCTLSIPEYLPYFSPPVTGDIYLKLDWKFSQSPVFITLGDSFVVEVTPTGNVPDSLDKVGINLVCDSLIIETWNNIKLSQAQTLIYSHASGAPLFNCIFQTVSNEEIFIPAIAPVIVVNLESPFGGPLFYISPSAVSEFAQRISSVSGWASTTTN